MADLKTDIRYIKGIGEQRAKSLSKLGIATLRDLISYYPRGYEDRTLTRPIATSFWARTPVSRLWWLPIPPPTASAAAARW